MAGLAAIPANAITSLILPTYNPGNRILATWKHLREFLDHQQTTWEVLFVCDGCTDGTAERLQHLTRTHRDQVQVLSYAKNQGKGYAVYRGFAAAKGQWIIFTDVDLAYGLGDVARLANILRDGAEVVIGARYHPESMLHVPEGLERYVYWRRWQSKIFSTLVRHLLPLKLKDTQAGLKGFSARVIEKLLPFLQSRGFEFDCELLTGCVHLGVPIIEMPVSVRYDGCSSTTSWKNAVSMLHGVWNIRRNWKQVDLAPMLESEQGFSAAF